MRAPFKLIDSFKSLFSIVIRLPSEGLTVSFVLNPKSFESLLFKTVDFGTSSKELPSDYFDLIISNNALEHCENPFLELKELHRSLKKNGKICIVVPLDSLNYKYVSNDIDFHLYSWSPINKT